MKHQFIKILLVIFILLFAQNRVHAQPNTCTWVGSTSGTQDFNTLSNWQYLDYTTMTYLTPAAISDVFTFKLNNSSFNIQLSANTTIGKLFVDGGTLDFNGKSLTLNYLKLENSITVDNSKAGSKIIYTSERR